MLNSGSATLATYSNLNKASGYPQRSFSSRLRRPDGDRKFLGTEDASLQTSFVLDDTAIDVS